MTRAIRSFDALERDSRGWEEAKPAPEIAQAALAELCQTYWAPLYSFVRSRGYAMHDAQDLTQSFFAYLIEHKIYARVDRAEGQVPILSAGIPEEFPGGTLMTVSKR